MKAIIISVLVSLSIVSLEVDIRSSINITDHAVEEYEFEKPIKVVISAYSKTTKQVIMTWSDYQMVDQVLLIKMDRVN